MITALCIVSVVVLVGMFLVVALGVVAVRYYPDPLDFDVERL